MGSSVMNLKEENNKNQDSLNNKVEEIQRIHNTVVNFLVCQSISLEWISCIKGSSGFTSLREKKTIKPQLRIKLVPLPAA